MKKITLLLLLLFPVVAIAQGPWEFTNTTDGWTKGGGCTDATGATAWTLTTNGGNNPNITNASSGVDADTYTIAAVTIRVSAGGPSYMRLRFPKDDASGYIFKPVVIDPSETGFVTYYIDASDSNWSGTEDDIRFQFKDDNSTTGGANHSSTGETIEIDRVEFICAIPVTEKLAYEFATNGDAEGWTTNNSSVSVSGGIMTVTPVVSTSAKILQNVNSVDADANQYLHVTYKNLSASNNQLRFQYRYDGDCYSGFNGENTSINQSMSNFEILTIDLSSETEWTGETKDFQLVIRDTGNAGNVASAGDLEIERIEFNNIANYSVTDDDWDVAATWSNGIPSVTDNVVINSDVIVRSDEIINDVTIASGETLIVNKGESLTITGNLVTDSGVNNSLVVRCDADEFASLIVEGTATGDIRFRRYVNDNEATAGNDLIASPVQIASFDDFYTDNSAFFVEDTGSDAVLFGPFDNGANPGVYENWDFDDTSSLDSGVGYRMGTNGTLAETSALNFHGTINTSDVSVTITSEIGDFGKWNLIGNPYSSYITLEDFLSENNSEFDASSAGVYGYDGDASDGWQIWNQAYSDANSGALITPGQGFFVASKSGGGTVDFTTDMRTTGSSDDFISRNSSSNSLGYFKINLNSSESSYFTDFYFNTNASQNLDPGYDSKVFGVEAPSFSIYSHLVQGNIGESMAVQSLGATDLADVVIPIGINATQGEQITISMSDFDLPTSVEVYLEDTLENTFTLLNTSDYTITPDSNLNGTGRFYLRVSEDALSTIDNALDTVQLFALNNELVVKGNLEVNTVLNMYDINGRLIAKSILDVSKNRNTVDVSNVTTGVYVVVLDNETYTKTIKVILN